MYRPDENSPNTAISYYTKGAVVAFLLDAKIRRATERRAQSGRRDARGVSRTTPVTRGFTPDEFRALTEHVAGTDLGAFWRSAIEGTDELDYSEALDVFGLQLQADRDTDLPNGPRPGSARRRAIDAGRLLVAQVRRDTPAFAAGLNVDDEIVAIDEVRVRADRLDERLEQYAPGDRVALLVARRDRLLSLDVVLGAEPPEPGASSPRPSP